MRSQSRLATAVNVTIMCQIPSFHSTGDISQGARFLHSEPGLDAAIRSALCAFTQRQKAMMAGDRFKGAMCLLCLSVERVARISQDPRRQALGRNGRKASGEVDPHVWIRRCCSYPVVQHMQACRRSQHVQRSGECFSTFGLMSLAGISRSFKAAAKFVSW